MTQIPEFQSLLAAAIEYALGENLATDSRRLKDLGGLWKIYADAFAIFYLGADFSICAKAYSVINLGEFNVILVFCRTWINRHDLDGSSMRTKDVRLCPVVFIAANSALKEIFPDDLFIISLENGPYG